MTDPYNSAPRKKDPWREVPVKKDRRRSSNPKRLSKRAQRANHKSLLDWSADMLRRPSMRLPGGRSSHDMAREQIALVRAQYRSNPRSKEYVIAGKKGKKTLYYAGGAQFKDRASAKKFATHVDAAASLWLLRQAFTKALKSWHLRVSAA